MLQTVKKLCALSGVSGWEDEVRDAILTEAMELCDEMQTDAMGNLFFFKKGRVAPETPVMLCAHMDEVGILITGYGEDGYLRFDFVGDVDRRVALGKRVFVGPDRIPGVIGLRAIHLTPRSERESTVPETDNLFVDIGATTPEEAREKVKQGWRGVFDGRIAEFGDGYLKAKALDDRIGCAALLKIMEEELPVDTWFAFTVQEEVDFRGAIAAGNRIRPGVALVLEGTTAADIPNVAPGREVCRLGKGIVIPFMDRGAVYSHELWESVTALCDKNGIPWQTKGRIAGGTDGSVLQRSGEGARVLTLSVPVRNIHSPASVCCISDMLPLPCLCMKILEELSHGL